MTPPTAPPKRYAPDPTPDPPPSPPASPRHPTRPVPTELRVGRALRLLGRGALRRCPNCGSGGLFRRWILMRRTCPGCHLVLDRNEADYFIGSFTVNFVTAELVICIGGLVAILATWPDVPWDAIKWGLVATMVPLPVAFLPFARTLWLALDLTFRPLTLADLDGHGELAPDIRPQAPPAGSA